MDIKEKKFLLVENDPNDAYLIRRALKSYDCGTSFVCRNVSEAKAYLKGAGMYQNRFVYPLPEVVLTDLIMEGETGIELVSWLRIQDAPLKDMVIIVLTGSASPEQMALAEKAGAQKVYSKPTRLEDLLELMGKIAKEYCS